MSNIKHEQPFKLLVELELLRPYKFREADYLELVGNTRIFSVDFWRRGLPERAIKRWLLP